MTQFKGFAGLSETQLRLLWSFLLQQDSTGIATDGVLAGLGVSQTTTASAAVQVGKGAGQVQDSLLDGASPMVLDTDLSSFDVLTANPMGGVPRNDIVVFDAATLAAGTGGIRSITGTPNAVPTDPTVPASAIPLARLRHAASATTIPAAKIDDLRVFTGLFGNEDTGWVSVTTAGFTPAAGFSGLSGTVRKRGGVVNVNFTIASTSAIAAGNVANINMINVPTAYQSAGGGAVQGGPFGPSWQGFTSGGTIQLSSTTGGINAGDQFSVVGTYLQ